MSEHATDALATYWDALTAGRPAEPLSIDPALSNAVRQFHRAADVPGPDPDFVARLERALVASGGPIVQAAPEAHGIHVRKRVAPSKTWGRAEATSPPTMIGGRARWAAAQAATAALLALTLAAGYIAFRHSPPPVLPVPGHAFLAATPDAATADGLLLQATVDSVPSVPGYIGIDRWRFAPHAGASVSGPLSGPSLFFVTQGQLTAKLSGAGQVVRGMGASESILVAANVAVDLSPGDGLIVPANVGYAIGNDGSSPAAADAFYLLKATATDQQGPVYDERLIQDDMLVSDDPGIAFPSGPTRIEMRRATLAPGEAVPSAPTGTYQIVAAETKPLAYFSRGPGGATTNKETESLPVIVVTTRPEGSPAATPSPAG